jgi:hypothetical protein
MSKIKLDADSEKVEISTRLGRSGKIANVTVDREVAEAGIDLGFGSIGVTTDYGGGISLGLLGQEITWGREGGTIHIGVGGFNVDVEARDCIVTEIKSIAGHIVAQRSYPDPGCELPPPTPTPSTSPVSPNPAIPAGVEVPNTDVEGWVFVHVLAEGTDFAGKFHSHLFFRSITSPLKERLPRFVARSPVDMSVQAFKEFPNVIVKKNGIQLWVHRIPVYDVIRAIKREVPLNTELTYQFASSLYNTGDRNPLFFLGVFRDIRNFLEINNAQNKAIAALDTTYTRNTYIPYACVPYYGEVEEPNQPFLPTGNKPPMKDCCEEVLDYLADFAEAFDIERLLKDKFPVSNVFMAPECDPASKTEAKTYYEIMQCAFRVMAHGLIFEPRVEIKDADAAKAGDQNFKARYLNATGWASAVSEALLEVRDDGNVSTNMDIRNGFAVTQTMVGMADALYRLETILDCLGIKLIPKVETVETPYNLQIKVGKGFGKGNERQIDLNTDEATEKLLPSFLQTQKNAIKTVEIHPRGRSILEILENIEANLPGASSG